MAPHTTGNSKPPLLENNPLCRCTLMTATIMSMKTASAANRVRNPTTSRIAAKLRRNREVAHPARNSHVRQHLRELRHATEKFLIAVRDHDQNP